MPDALTVPPADSPIDRLPTGAIALRVAHAAWAILQLVGVASVWTSAARRRRGPPNARSEQGPIGSTLGAGGRALQGELDQLEPGGQAPDVVRRVDMLAKDAEDGAHVGRALTIEIEHHLVSHILGDESPNRPMASPAMPDLDPRIGHEVTDPVGPPTVGGHYPDPFARATDHVEDDAPPTTTATSRRHEHQPPRHQPTETETEQPLRHEVDPSRDASRGSIRRRSGVHASILAGRPSRDKGRSAGDGRAGWPGLVTEGTLIVHSRGAAMMGA